MTRPLRDADAVAEALREEPPALDELSVARLERDLLQRMRAGETADAPAPAPRRSRAWFAGGVAVGLAAAAAVALVWWNQDARPVPSGPATEDPGGAIVATQEPALFEAVRDGVPVRRGAFAEGEHVITAEGQLVRVRFGGAARERSDVEVSPDSRVHFASVTGDDHRIALERGRVRVTFHPERRGDQHFTVDTDAARVEVVGTVFDVRVDAIGTHVSVEEGVVRVVPRHGEASLVRAGASLTVQRELAQRLPEEDETLEVREDLEAEDEERPVGALPSRARTPDDEEPAAADLPPPVVVETAIEETAPSRSQATEEERDDAPSERESDRSATPLQDDARFDLAMRFMDRGDYGRARHELLAITRTTRSRVTRARAWTDIAVSYTRQAEVRRAAEAYRRAHEAAPGTAASNNALFALGQMRLSAGDEDAARQVFREYVFSAPEGALTTRARRTLCRLGDRPYCTE